MDAVDLEKLRQQARAQLDRRTPPRTAWIEAFEAELREVLTPRAHLFLNIMSAAGDSGLDDPADTSGHDRGWLIGHVDSFVVPSLYPDTGDRTTCLVLCPGRLGFQTTIGDLMKPVGAVVRKAPQQSVITGGEIEQASALGEVAIARYRNALPGADPREDARRYAEACDRRMLALLCANELTFPDRDLATVEWDQYETYIITRAEQQRRLAGRAPMTVAEFARWMEGTLTDEEREGKVVPSLTGAEFAQALSMTSIEPQRRYRRNWRNKLVDVGEKGWQIGKEELDKSETSVTTAYTFIRRDGTGFREVSTSSWSSSTAVTEYDADHVYAPSVYSSYLSTRLFYASRGMTA